MLIECAWCRTITGEKGEQEGITSGICDSCMEENFPVEFELVKKLREKERRKLCRMVEMVLSVQVKIVDRVVRGAESPENSICKECWKVELETKQKFTKWEGKK